MPFVSAKDRRGLQPMTQPPLVAPEVKDDPTYGETFDAAVGLVIDEAWSVSSLFNQQQFHRRNQETRTLIDEGVINPRDYEYGDGKFDFNKLSRDLRNTEYEGRIQTDREAREARNEHLAMKRKYAESVLAEGPGMAQFLGSATAYMLDPINIATMGIGTVPAAAKGLTAAATALSTAKRTAGLVAASEAGIQAFVTITSKTLNHPTR